MGIVRHRRDVTPAKPSRRALLRGAVAALVLPPGGLLAGCTALSSANVRLDAAAISARPTLLVATTRKPVNGARPALVRVGARPGLSVARAKLTPPEEGRFSLARRPRGLAPRVRSSRSSDRRSDPVGIRQRDVLIYVHGFNQTFETAALDAARLSDGIRFRGETMVFAWPSKAKLFDYGYDRESAMWSRDALEQVLPGLMASPAVGRIHIVAHSVGTMLTMEALRQIYARHGGGHGEDRRGGIRLAGYRHGCILLLGRAHRPLVAEDHRGHLYQRSRACRRRVG